MVRFLIEVKLRNIRVKIVTVEIISIKKDNCIHRGMQLANFANLCFMSIPVFRLVLYKQYYCLYDSTAFLYKCAIFYTKISVKQKNITTNCAIYYLLISKYNKYNKHIQTRDNTKQGGILWEEKRKNGWKVYYIQYLPSFWFD